MLFSGHHTGLHRLPIGRLAPLFRVGTPDNVPPLGLPVYSHVTTRYSHVVALEPDTDFSIRDSVFPVEGAFAGRVQGLGANVPWQAIA
jgi:hypothetical protein